jgi:signal transduction histidine kinase
LVEFFQAQAVAELEEFPPLAIDDARGEFRVSYVHHTVLQWASLDALTANRVLWIKVSLHAVRARSSLMVLKRETTLLGIAALGLPLLELVLARFGMSLIWRVLVALTGIAIIGFVAVRAQRRLFADLAAIHRAIDETARGEFESAIQVSGTAEAEALAEALRVMRERLAEMGRGLAAAVRMESLNLLGSILVHDMKNLSFRLRSLSQNIAANYADPAFRESLVRTLNETTGQMDQMVHRFRTQKELVTVKVRINLNAVVHSALGNTRRDAAGIRISEQYEEIPLIWADAMLLENAIYNVAENAREAMRRGGLLAVRTRLVAGDANGSSQAVVEIADTGPGMSEEFIRKDLFAPFVTTKPRGLGLGLYTCRQIISMHDGEIKVRSEPGRGTIFSIHLPITD